MGSRVLSDPQKEAGLKMPGHIKLVKGAVDPDPTDFLWPTMDMKKEDQAKPYDPKASVWIQDPKTHADVTKNLRKSERSIKELTFAADEDRKNHERMQALIDQLQGKVTSYKKQIEEAEEIAAL